MNETITSLCYVSKRSEKSVELCRIADFHHDRFEPYQYDNSVDFYGNERDLLYGSAYKISSEIESIGVYEWYAYQDAANSWRIETQISTVPWIEVVFSQCATPESIVNLIKSGWKYTQYDKLHDLIICCAGNTQSLKSIYLSKDAVKVTNNTITFADDTYSVEVGTIDARNSVGSCRCRYSSYDTRKYLNRVDAWRKTGSVQVKSVNEILDSIVSEQIGRIEKDALSRKERQAARSALAKLSTPTMEQIVGDRLNCSAEEAKSYVQNYLKTHSDLLSEDRISSWIEILLQGDSHAVAELRKRVEADWQEENAGKIAAAQQDIAAARDVLQNIKNEQQSARSELATLADTKKEYESQTEDIMQLQSDIEAEIKKQLDAIRNHKASVAVIDAFLGAAISRQIRGAEPISHETESAKPTKPGKGYRIKFSGTNPEVQEDRIAENFGVFVDSIEPYCTPEADINALALALFSSFTCRQHLVITGETAESLAQAYSASVTGVCSPVVTIPEDADADALLRELQAIPHTIVSVRQVNSAAYEVVRELMRLLPDTQFVLIHDHEESLFMEPNSYYTTFLPVYTDMFCQSSDVSIPDGYECQKLLRDDAIVNISQKELSAEKAKWKKWIGNASHSSLLLTRCAKLQIAMRRVAQEAELAANTADISGMMYLYTPLMKALQRTESLADRLKNDSILSSASKELIKAYCGIEEE